MWPFSRKSRRQLGVDIGTSAIKIVELERSKNYLNLTNYGIMDGSDFFGEMPTKTNVPAGLKISDSEIATVIKRLLTEAKIKTTSSVMSIPIFASFLTVMELPSMEEKELDSAIPFQARSYIPVPLSEVVLDWSVIPHKLPAASSAPNVANQQGKIDVLLMAVPKETVSKYQRIAAASGLELIALESDSFSLARALVGNDLGTIMLIDFGARNTNLSIIDSGFIYMSHSGDVSGKDITRAISNSINVAPSRAEELKRSIGMSQTGLEKGVAQVIQPLVDKLILEIERMNSLFLKKEGSKIDKVVLTGGSSNMPGLKEYLSRGLGVEVIVGNPFSRVKFDKSLDTVLRRDLNSTLAVSVGLAMREF